MALPLVQAGELFTVAVLAGYIDKVPPTTFLKSFFPSTTVTTKTVKYPVRRSTRPIALDQKRGTEGQLNKMSLYSEKQFVPPYFKEYINMTELDIYDRVFNPSRATVEQVDVMELANIVVGEVSALSDKIMRAENKQIADLLSTGSIPLINGDDIDFKRSVSAVAGVAAGIWTIQAVDKWTEAGKVVETLGKGIEYMRAEGNAAGGGAVNAVLGCDAMETILNDSQIKERLNFRRADLALINQPAINAAGGVYHGRITIKSWNVDLWTYPDSYTNASGDDVQFINPKDCHLFASSFVGQTVYAGVPMVPNWKTDEERQLLQRLANVAPGHMPWTAKSEMVEAHNFGFKAAPIAIPKSVDQVVSLIGVID